MSELGCNTHLAGYNLTLWAKPPPPCAHYYTPFESYFNSEKLISITWSSTGNISATVTKIVSGMTKKMIIFFMIFFAKSSRLTLFTGQI